VTYAGLVSSRNQAAAPAQQPAYSRPCANLSGVRHTVQVNGQAGRGWVGVLGPIELIGDGPVHLGGAMERCLLAALTVHCGEAVSAASLMDALWGDDPPRTAGKTLQNYVLHVRRAMAGLEGLSIVTQPSGYCLRALPGTVDARLAESLIGEGRQGLAGGDPAAAVRLLRRALSLWRGSALQEFADRPFAAAEALRLEELREAALEDLFDAELALGRHHEVVAGLEGLVASDPLRERRWGQLMVALYRDGRQAEALGAFHRLRQALDRDLGVVPSAELRHLYQAILQHSPILTWHSRQCRRMRPGQGTLAVLPRCLGCSDAWRKRARGGAGLFCWLASQALVSPTPWCSSSNGHGLAQP